MSLIEQIEKISRQAGKVILDVYADAFEVEYKPDSSPVTIADILASKLILNELRALDSEIPVLCEEAVAAFPGPNQKNQFWLVDPLDGTKEFVKRTAEFTVNIALIEKGKPVLGVVYLPAKDILYSAVSGQGAYKTTSFDDAVVIRSKARAFDEKWRIVGSRSHAGNIDNWLQKLGDFELIPVGSSLKFCLVAEGSAHLYPRFTPTHFWDTAAGQIIVEEAGGKVIDLQGMPVSYQNSCQSLNPWFIVSNNEFKLHDFC